MKLQFKQYGVLVASLLMLAAGGALAQAPGIQRTVVTRADVSVPGREAVVVRAELPAGGHVGKHTHPGDEISYVTEGEFQLLVDGQPPRIVKAGESFIIPAGTVHDGNNMGSTPAKLIGVYVVEKGKPLATPAP